MSRGSGTPNEQGRKDSMKGLTISGGYGTVSSIEEWDSQRDILRERLGSDYPDSEITYMATQLFGSRPPEIPKRFDGNTWGTFIECAWQEKPVVFAKVGVGTENTVFQEHNLDDLDKVIEALQVARKFIATRGKEGSLSQEESDEAT